MCRRCTVWYRFLAESRAYCFWYHCVCRMVRCAVCAVLIEDFNDCRRVLRSQTDVTGLKIVGLYSYAWELIFSNPALYWLHGHISILIFRKVQDNSFLFLILLVPTPSLLSWFNTASNTTINRPVLRRNTLKRPPSTVTISNSSGTASYFLHHISRGNPTAAPSIIKLAPWMLYLVSLSTFRPPTN